MQAANLHVGGGRIFCGRNIRIAKFMIGCPADLANVEFVEVCKLLAPPQCHHKTSLGAGMTYNIVQRLQVPGAVSGRDTVRKTENVWFDKSRDKPKV